jgi:hypothetical protein
MLCIAIFMTNQNILAFLPATAGGDVGDRDQYGRRPPASSAGVLVLDGSPLGALAIMLNLARHRGTAGADCRRTLDWRSSLWRLSYIAGWRAGDCSQVGQSTISFCTLCDTLRFRRSSSGQRLRGSGALRARRVPGLRRGALRMAIRGWRN